MTRRDYVLLSDALAAARQSAGTNWGRREVEGVDIAALAVADALAAQSRGFNRERFLDTIGTEPLGTCGPCECSDCKPVTP